MGNLFWLVGDMQGNGRETREVKKKKKLLLLGYWRTSRIQGNKVPKISHPHAHVCTHVRTDIHTHTHLYRYWPDVQDVPIKKAESNFNFLLCENPNQDRPHCFLTPVGVSG